MPGINPALLKASLDAVSDRGAELTKFFYGRLFLLASSRQQPEVARMFPLVMTAQRDRLLAALVHIVGQAAEGDMDGLTSYLEALGRDHRMIGDLRPEHYETVGEALLATLAEYAGAAWTPEVQDTWTEAYGLVSRAMIKAMEDDGTPRWWEATVTACRMATPDVVMLSVQLDQPMQWLPGQSVRAEIIRPEDAAPSVRRYLTPANSPGSGILMEFHVKVLPWGIFSPALARAAQPGAMLRLSSPVGTLTLGRERSRPVTMIAGSTGITPMLSMLSALAWEPKPPRTAVYFGAREPDGLYAAPALDKLAADNDWLTVTYAVEASRTPGFPGEHGTVVEVATRRESYLRDIVGHDVYACGPRPMLQELSRRLGEAGLPEGQLHTESFGLD